MIGVISKKNEIEATKEFFELFKTPWEFYQVHRSYDVVITTVDYYSKIKSKLLIIYSNEKTEFDSKIQIFKTSQRASAILEYNRKEIPIYGKLLTFDTIGKIVIKAKGTNEAAGIEVDGKCQKILRIGFNLFHEIDFLLSTWQPADFGYIPSFDLHISMLRDWILNSGIPLLEIPPVPAGYDFTACLTHDVDFFGIRKHKFDLTMFGFIYRALFCSLFDLFKGRCSWNKLLKNWKSLLLLPGIYLGIVQDFWVQPEQYIDVEKGLVSTFFIIPFKNINGSNGPNRKSKRRSVKYDINDIKPTIKKLISCGCEIGVHGIDAWLDPEKGCKEFKRIASILKRSDIGIRMHWLYFNKQSPKVLEKAGFLYDSTLGYNDAVGYRSGTTQIFRPLNTNSLLEVSLHLQDTAIFSSERKYLSELNAFELTKELIDNTEDYGGIFTINWHFRSMAPDRLWDNFYIKTLEELKRRKAWFATIRDAVNWFAKRRAIFFEKAEITQNSVNLKLRGYKDNLKPGLLLRIYKPNSLESASTFSTKNKNYIDFPLKNNMELQLSF